MKLDQNILNAIETVVNQVMQHEAKRATKYLGPKLVVRATLRTSNKDEFVKGRTQVLVTFGVPNKPEKEFIISWQKDKKQFPIQAVQLKFLPKKK